MREDNTLVNPFSENRFTIENIDIIFYFGSMFDLVDDSMPSQTMVHEHAMYELHCVQKGHLNVKADGKTIIINKNEALFIPPHKYHMSYCEEEQTKYVRFSFEIKKNSKELAENLYDLLKSELDKKELFLIKNSREITELGMKLKCYAQKGGYPNNAWVKNILISFIFILFEKISNGKNLIDDNVGTQNNDALGKRNYLLDMITTNEIDNMSLDEVSQKIFLSKKQINRIVKQRYNMTYKQKQIRFRIENSKKLLVDTDKPIDKIAEAVGYTNLTSFYKSFREIVGMTPSQYRKGP